MSAQINQPYFTVFTPTYNRRGILATAYHSLLRQTDPCFEWVIVDDGSNDGTDELVASWQKEAPFLIRYFWQHNQHKKVAHNRAVKEAQGSLFVILDSDDELVPQALERFKSNWLAIPELERINYLGIWALCQDATGAIVGRFFPSSPMDAHILDMGLRYKNRWEHFPAIQLSILRENLFPENIDGLVPEGLLWNALGTRYLIRYINEPLRIYHKLDNVASLSEIQNTKQFAAGRALYEREFFKIAWPWFRYSPMFFCKRAIQFVRFHLHCRASVFKQSRGIKGRWLIMFMVPLGFLLFLIDAIQG